MASLRERKKADTRTRLSVAAVELLVAEGVEGATVSAIAGRAGVSTRTFHNYFAHREDAFVHFLHEHVADWAQQVAQAPEGMAPLEVLRSMFRELYGRSADDIAAAENLLVVGELIGILLGAEARTLAEHILDPLYEAVGRRVPHVSRFRVRVMVDLSLAACASVLRHVRSQRAPGPGGGQSDDDNADYRSEGSRAGVDLTGLLDDTFELLKSGADRDWGAATD